jgi:N-formylglutamate amidohydrolase
MAAPPAMSSWAAGRVRREEAMTSRRQLLFVAPLLCLSPVARAAEPADLVLVQQGTLPILLTAPHGGRMAVPGVMPRAIAPRPPEDTSFVTTVDPETDRLALGIAARIKALTQGDVYLVVARFDRKYIDANRAPGIAFDQAAAQPYYDAYHAAIRRFVDEIRARHPHGLLIDVHGQAKIPDGLARGTIDGRSIRQLLARAGAAAMTGPNGLFGQLERNGFRVVPDNAVPFAGRTEDPRFNGGYTVDRYGSHGARGIDAVQCEFGADYRRKAAMDRTIEGAARAIVAFRETYLT